MEVRFNWYIIGVCLGSWALSVLLAPGLAVETLLGMLLPLGLGVATVAMVTRIYRKEAARLTSAMAGAFFVKMLLCALYVGVVVGVLSFRPVPFAISFTVYFITLHTAEAFYFKSLFQSH